MPPREGSELAGYRLLSLLGRGGSGTVYLAEDTRLGRKVALKVLTTEAADAPGVRQRFVAESRLAASLDHPHIVPIYEAGEASGELFIAMRYVPGPDLAGLIRGSGQLPPDRAARIVGQIASALDAAHAAGLIHRDVKPGNILLAEGAERGSDHAYLTDFGLTKQATYAGADATRTGQLLGTIGYVAPEQIAGLPIDARVDVYSLGCVLYECLAGTAPYARETDLAVLMAHVESPPPSLAALRPDLGPAIDAVVARALAKRAEDRYPTAGDLGRAASSALSPSESRVSPLTRGFLFADLRGYTDYVEAHGDRAAAELLDVYRRLVRNVVRGHHGAEIKTEGDGFYLVFPSASSAVACGRAIVAAAESATRDEPTTPIRVAVGIHAGESTRTDDGYVGLAVNTAARICGVAQAGEVLVSDTVRSIARTSHEFTFEPRGRRILKGIAEPVALFAAAPATPRAEPDPSTRAGRFRPRPGGRAVGILGLAGVALVAAVAIALTALPALTASAGPPSAPPTSAPPTSAPPAAAASLASDASGLPAVGSSATPAVPESSSASPGGSVTSLEIVDDQRIPLSPGIRYRPTQFELPTEFEVPAGWLLDRAYTDGFTLARADDLESPQLGYLGAGFVQVVVDGPCIDSKTKALPRDPTALVDWLQSNRWLSVSDPRPINIAGYTGLSVDVGQAKSPKGKCNYDSLGLPDAARQRLERQVYIFVFGEDNFHIDAGEKVRVSVLDVAGRPVTLLTGVPDASTFDSFAQDEAQPVLDSLSFKP
jgi:class 3 adenylate cyclase